jgi:chromosome segregation protein
MAVNLNCFKLAYINQAQKNIEDQTANTNSDISKISDQIKLINAKIVSLEATHNKMANNSVVHKAEQISKELGLLEASAQQIDQEISNLNIEIQEISSKELENNLAVSRTTQDIDQYRKNISDHDASHKELEASVSKYDAKLAIIDEKIKGQTKILDQAKKALAKTQKTDYLLHSLGLIDILQDSINRGRPSGELDIVFYKLRRSIKHSINDNSAELALSVGKVQNVISRLLDEREKLVELQTVEIIKLRASEMDSAAILLKIKQLEKQLNDIQKSQASSKTVIAKPSYKKLSELEKSRQKLHIQIEAKRLELVGIAGQNQQDEDAEYFSRHEELISQKVSLDYRMQTYKESLNVIAKEAQNISQLQKTWFPAGTKGITPTGRKVDISEIESLAAQLSMLQEIDPEVQKGAQEALERMDYLQGQKSDLEKALADLEKLSESTNKKMQVSFRKGFDKINRNFSKSFIGLFGGGSAELALKELTEGFGIEIIVQLPNKKLQPISSLSGGEKALASVALLSAILYSNPSPFVVLDEVDAALDEQNTKKFANVISDITKHSQVLVITHNHETMSSASELLGVTTSGNNDSHIIRVRLDNLASVSPS